MDRPLLGRWLAVLDDLGWYALLGVSPEATPDEIKRAFHGFAETFHPDAHRTRPADERDAIGRIFRRGTEAYRVLGDEALRAAYDARVARGGTALPGSRSSAPPTPADRGAGSRRLEDFVRSPSARPFARRAEELMKAGDWKQAKLQLTLAASYEPGCEALEATLRDVEARLRAR